MESSTCAVCMCCLYAYQICHDSLQTCEWELQQMFLLLLLLLLLSKKKKKNESSLFSLLLFPLGTNFYHSYPLLLSCLCCLCCLAPRSVVLWKKKRRLFVRKFFFLWLFHCHFSCLLHSSYPCCCSFLESFYCDCCCDYCSHFDLSSSFCFCPGLFCFSVG